MLSPEECCEWAQTHANTAIYHVSGVELPGITLPEIEKILEAGAKAQLAPTTIHIVLNIKRGWDYLYHNYQSFIDWNLISRYHSIIGAGLPCNPGKMRTGSVRVKGTEWQPDTPRLETITTRLNSTWDEPTAAHRAAARFAEICRGQFFEDGNKRTASIVANHELIHDGVGLFLLDNDTVRNGTFSTELIHYYETDNRARFVEWLLCHAVYNLATDSYYYA